MAYSFERVGSDAEAVYMCMSCEKHKLFLVDTTSTYSAVTWAILHLSEINGNWPFGFTQNEIEVWMQQSGDMSYQYHGGEEDLRPFISADLLSLQRHGGVVKLTAPDKTVRWTTHEIYQQHKYYNPPPSFEESREGICSCIHCITAARRRCVCRTHDDHLGIASLDTKTAMSPLVNCPYLAFIRESQAFGHTCVCEHLCPKHLEEAWAETADETPKVLDPRLETTQLKDADEETSELDRAAAPRSTAEDGGKREDGHRGKNPKKAKSKRRR